MNSQSNYYKEYKNLEMKFKLIEAKLFVAELGATIFEEEMNDHINKLKEIYKKQRAKDKSTIKDLENTITDYVDIIGRMTNKLNRMIDENNSVYECGESY